MCVYKHDEVKQKLQSVEAETEIGLFFFSVRLKFVVVPLWSGSDCFLRMNLVCISFVNCSP